MTYLYINRRRWISEAVPRFSWHWHIIGILVGGTTCAVAVYGVWG